MRARIVSLAVIGSTLCSAPAFAQSEVSSKPEQQWIHGALLGGVAVPVAVGAAIYWGQGCPKPDFAGFQCLAGELVGLALVVPGGLLGGFIEWQATSPRGDATATLIPSTNGRDAVSLHLFVRF